MNLRISIEYKMFQALIIDVNFALIVWKINVHSWAVLLLVNETPWLYHETALRAFDLCIYLIVDHTIILVSHNFTYHVLFSIYVFNLHFWVSDYDQVFYHHAKIVFNHH
mgnify:CR=1 FL=1